MADEDQRPFDLIATILKRCVILKGQDAPTQDERLEAAAHLRAWIDAQAEEARKERHPTSQHIETGITPEVVLERLQAVAQALRQDRAMTGHIAEEGRELVEENQDENVSYHRFFWFVDHVLNEPPTKVDILAKTFGVDPTTIRRWLEGKMHRTDKATDVLLDALKIHCSAPEPPVRTIPEVPFKSFDELRFLGNLRYTFNKLYQADGSKPAVPSGAQAQLIPGILGVLDKWFDGKDIGRCVVIAPTNGGKNGMILAAALAAIAWNRRPVIVLQPHRAQIAESFETWSMNVAGRTVPGPGGSPRGISVAGSSALQSDHDLAIVKGSRDLITIIPEKLTVLSRQHPLENFCAFLIVDELLVLFDEDRGPKLEIIVTLAREAGLPIMATGAAVTERAGKQVARWLAKLPSIADPRETGHLLWSPIPRDPPIEYVVWRRDGARIRWSNKDEGQIEEKVPPFERGSREDNVAELVVRELEESPDRQLLVFIESRERVLEVAGKIFARLEVNDATRAAIEREVGDADDGKIPLESLWVGEAPPACPNLSQIIAGRVGIHSRGFPKTNLARIERAFRDRRLRVLCATTTVEAGINLPVDTVVQVGLKAHNHRDLRQATLEQRLGRAGRTIGGVSRKARGIVYIPEDAALIDQIIPRRILTPDDVYESKLDNQHLALLLLVALAERARDGVELLDVVGNSYWAFEKPKREIAGATEAALGVLKERELVVAFDDEPDRWHATALGRALAAALLMPNDAPALRVLVDTAAREPASREEWLSSVLFAACCVPVIADSARRPRHTDLPQHGKQTLGAMIATYCDRDQDGRWTFGFPRRRAMPVTADLAKLVERVHNQRLSPQRRQDAWQLTALIRTYVAWLWTMGEPLDPLHAYIRELSDSVVEEDLAYYLSHVLRAAGWFAVNAKRYRLGDQLDELSLEVTHGVPISAVAIRSTFGDWIDRRRALAVSATESDLRDLVNELVPEADRALECEEIDRRADARRQRNVSLAKEALGGHDVQLQRMESPQDAMRWLGQVWDDPPTSPSLEGDVIRVGGLTIEFRAARLTASPECTHDFVLSNEWLGDSLAWSRDPQPAAILGPEEFAVLLAELCISPDQPKLLAEVAARKRVCRPELVVSLANEVRSPLAPAD